MVIWAQIDLFFLFGPGRMPSPLGCAGTDGKAFNNVLEAATKRLLMVSSILMGADVTNFL